ncbi:hypothetical protein LNTAR_12081 [Lentisphaera araneosa HTCC2155]|jgi:hypothetical protein|uniref:Uncharacterized protein n=1 Tax=Lentisphaera araneosa HTCC2155 TaxID=313628 RepID=A6DJL7_9BACT|nr:hypothetical protein [Lentisphaera araneosa]EDM28091.1 hypothetical protein LNTAR_12081 [Lentisphaera araneosa HTCC2155]
MKIKTFIMTLFLVSLSAVINASDEDQFKAYGKAITVMNIEKLALSPKEKEAFLEGVKAALKETKLNEKDQEGLAKLGQFLDQRASKTMAKTKSCDSPQGNCKTCP